MTRAWLGVLAAGLVFGVAACERSQPSGSERAATQPAGETAVTTMSRPMDSDAGTAARVDRMERARQRLDEDRQRFEQDTRSILAELDEHLQNWRRQTQTVEEETRRVSENKIAQLDAKVAQVRETLDQLADASDTAWVELAKGINAALREINQGLAAGRGGGTATAPATQPASVPDDRSSER